MQDRRKCKETIFNQIQLWKCLPWCKRKEAGWFSKCRWELDACGGLALENGQYHYVSTPGDTAPLSHYASRNNRFTYCDALPRHMRSVPGLHSPMLGFMLDGVPVYGPPITFEGTAGRYTELSVRAIDENSSFLEATTTSEGADTRIATALCACRSFAQHLQA